MILPLLLRIGDPRERLEEAVGRLHVDEVDVELAAEGLLDLLALGGSHEPGVDVDTGELVADRLVDERGRDRRVDAAGERAQHRRGTDLATHRLDLGLDDRGVRPRRWATADVVEEALEKVSPPFGVDDLGMELHAVDGPRGVVEGGHRCVGAPAGHLEAVGHPGDRVGVAHPDLCVLRPVDEQRRGGRRRRTACGRTRRGRCGPPPRRAPRRCSCAP